jgi:peptidoglycan hydrolase CwlO-like protein
MTANEQMFDEFLKEWASNSKYILNSIIDLNNKMTSINERIHSLDKKLDGIRVEIAMKSMFIGGVVSLVVCPIIVLIVWNFLK